MRPAGADSVPFVMDAPKRPRGLFPAAFTL